MRWAGFRTYAENAQVEHWLSFEPIFQDGEVLRFALEVIGIMV